MTPRFPRTRKFANPYALVAEDLVFCIIWLSAFAAVANWNGTDKCKNACGVAKGAVALGVLIWFVASRTSRHFFFGQTGMLIIWDRRLLWILTAFLSIYGCMYYRREGYLPGASRAPHNAAMIDPDKEAFSTAPHDDEYAPVHNVDEHEIHDLDPMQPQYGAGPSSSHLGDEPSYSGGYGGGYVPPTVHDENTSYSGYSGATGTSDVGGRVQFPHARYDNV
jgi:hypothetical protein